MIDFKNLTAEELTLLAEATALALSKGRSAAYISVLSSFLSSVGDLLQLIASHQGYIEELTEQEE